MARGLDVAILGFVIRIMNAHRKKCLGWPEQSTSGADLNTCWLLKSSQQTCGKDPHIPVYWQVGALEVWVNCVRWHGQKVTKHWIKIQFYVTPRLLLPYFIREVFPKKTEILSCNLKKMKGLQDRSIISGEEPPTRCGVVGTSNVANSTGKLIEEDEGKGW